MTRTLPKSVRNWLVPDEAMARRILRACATSPYAKSYFYNALGNGYSLEAVTSAIERATVKQKLDGLALHILKVC